MPDTTYYATPAGAGAKTGADWANAFGLAELLLSWTNDATTGDIYYLYSGTYTLTASFNTAMGAGNTSPIRIIGVSTQGSPGDIAQGTDRPLFICGSYTMTFEDYWFLRNLRFSGSPAGSLVAGDDYCMCENCYFINSNGSSSYYSLQWVGPGGMVINSEIESPNGIALALTGNNQFAYQCWIHDSYRGCYAGIPASFVECIFSDNSDYGIYCVSSMFINCTFYNNGIGIDFAGMHAIYNCQFVNNTIALDVGSSGRVSCAMDYNNYYNNGTDLNIGEEKGPNATAVDPLFTNAAGGDFSLQPGSPSIDAGGNIILGVG